MNTFPCVPLSLSRRVERTLDSESKLISLHLKSITTRVLLDVNICKTAAVTLSVKPQLWMSRAKTENSKIVHKGQD